jgi:formate/nitrite transporter FocA (FNT family)
LFLSENFSLEDFCTDWLKRTCNFIQLLLARKINLSKMTFDSFSALEVIEAVANTGVHKGNMRLDKVFFSSVSAGCLLSFACGTALSTNASPWFQENAAGLIRTISALVFPYGLCMIILTGADLCTGSFMVS